MKVTILLTLSFSLLAGVVAGAAPLTVAVYDFHGDGEAASYGNNVTTLVAADLTDETNLVVLERSDLSKVLNEQAFGVSGMVSADAAAKIGQITGVKVLVAGQVIKTGDNHLVIIASIMGTETSRLFAVKAEGGADNLLEVAADLSGKIESMIVLEATNLTGPEVESHDELLKRIVKNIAGTNRPGVSINITANNGMGQNWEDSVTETELGMILLQAGFTVVDEHSDKKPDIQIFGTASTETGLPRGGLLTGRATIELRLQDRRTGNIIGLDNQEATAMDLGITAAAKAAQIKAVDELAGRVLPVLAK